MAKPSVIFMGSKPGAVVALNHLYEQGWAIKAVCVSGTVSHPWYPEPDLKMAAKALGLPVFKQSELGQIVGEVDVVISYMFRHLVKPEIASKATKAAVNFHAAPLPEYGAGAPIIWRFWKINKSSGAPASFGQGIRRWTFTQSPPFSD